MKTCLEKTFRPKRLLGIACLLLFVPIAQAAEAAPKPQAAKSDSDGDFVGKVVETMSTAGYTYVLVETGGKQVWAAAREFAVSKGDSVKVVGGLPMANYHSKTLNRDFDVVYFTGDIVNESAVATDKDPAPALPAGHPALPGETSKPLPPNHPALTGKSPQAGSVDLSGIKKAEGGKTVQEIVFGSPELAGKSVTVRGKVVKYNAMVMGKNWLHIRDGSGSADRQDNDLTVTTSTSAKVGDMVLVTGVVSINKDFGAGYKYAVILDDAQVKVE